MSRISNQIALKLLHECSNKFQIFNNTNIANDTLINLFSNENPSNIEIQKCISILESYRTNFNTINDKINYYKLRSFILNKPYNYYYDINNFNEYEFKNINNNIAIIMSIFCEHKFKSVYELYNFALRDHILLYFPFLNYLIKSEYSDFIVEHKDLQINISTSDCSYNNMINIIDEFCYLFPLSNQIYIKIAKFEYIINYYKSPFMNYDIKNTIYNEILNINTEQSKVIKHILSTTNQNPLIFELWLELIIQDLNSYNNYNSILFDINGMCFKTVESLNKYSKIDVILKIFPFLKYLIKTCRPSYVFKNYTVQTTPFLSSLYDKNFSILCVKVLLKLCNDLCDTYGKIIIVIAMYDYLFRNYELINSNIKFKKTVINKMTEIKTANLHIIKKIIKDTNQLSNIFELWELKMCDIV